MPEHKRSRIMRSSCGILGSRNSATLAHTQYNGALLRRKHRSILGVRNICDASAPLLLRARKCVALHASAQMPMSTGEADSHEGCVRLGCHMQKFQDPRVA